MFKTKFIISTTLILIFLIITSVVKNKTRIIEKQISNLSKNFIKKKKYKWSSIRFLLFNLTSRVRKN